MSEERAKDPTAPVGQLLENFAIGEVARQLTWAEERVQLFHYRDRDQVEVDMVLEHAAGTVIGIEVKAAETVRTADFRGLRHLANRLGSRFRAGIVLYAGEQQLAFPSIPGSQGSGCPGRAARCRLFAVGVGLGLRIRQVEVAQPGDDLAAVQVEESVLVGSGGVEDEVTEPEINVLSDIGDVLVRIS